MKKLLFILLTLTLATTSTACKATAKEETTEDANPEIVVCVEPYTYLGTIEEIVDGDKDETDFVEGSLIINIPYSEMYGTDEKETQTVIVYVEEEISKLDKSQYSVGDTIKIKTDYQLDYRNAKDLPHVGAIGLEKVYDASSFQYEGTVKAITEGTVEVVLNDLGLVFIYITPEMTDLRADDFKIDEKVRILVDYKLDFTGAKDIPHVSPASIEKVVNE
jgi:hypothetical protein